MLLFTLGAAGATLFVALGLLFIPAIDACHGDSRGLVGCVRHLIDQRFDLPVGAPAGPAEQATAETAPLVAEVPTPAAPAEAPELAAAPAEPEITVVVPQPADQPAEVTDPVDVTVADAPLVAPDTQTVAPPDVPPLAPPDPPVAPAETPVADLAVPNDSAAVPLETSDMPVAPVVPLVVADLPVSDAMPEITRSLGPETGAAIAALPSASLPDAGQTTTTPAVIPDSIPPLPPLEAADDAGSETETAAEPELPPVVSDLPPAEPLAAPVLPPALASVLDAIDPLLLLPPVAEAPVPLQPVAKPAAAAETPDPPAAPASIDVAIADVPPAPAVPVIVAPPVLPPTIDAVEIDGEDNFVAGDGPAGALMRLYVDGVLVGESLVEEGRWLVEGVELFTRPSQLLRVDAVEPETGKVLSSTAVSFEIELPGPEAEPEAEPEAAATERPDDVAKVAAPLPEVPADLPPLLATPQTPAVVPEPPELAEANAPPGGGPDAPPAVIDAPVAAEPDVAALPAETVTEEANGVAAEAAVLAAVSEPPAVPEVPDVSSLSDAPVDPSVADAAVLPPIRPVVPMGETASVTILGVPASDTLLQLSPDQREQDSALVAIRPPAVIARFAIPAILDNIAVLRAVPSGDPGAGRFVTGKAIIRRGDTLWDIAHRYYGRGIRFDTIYRANRDRIARPSRIYPGQVFEIPLVYED